MPDSSASSRRTFLKEIAVSTAAIALSRERTMSAGPMIFDVIVVGGTTAGIGAAIAAGRKGLRVAVVEETPTLGGLIANGLCVTDGSAAACTGIFDEFRQRNLAYYQKHLPNDPIVKDHHSGRLGLRYEAHVAERIFREMFAEVPSISIFHERYVSTVLKTANRVTGVVTRPVDEGDELVFHAPITIDATHEGDLLPLAGAQFRLGREPRSDEEPHAGAIYMTESGEVFGSGKGDDKLQAYALLATVKDYSPAEAKPVARPPGYDPRNYAPEPTSDTFWYRSAALPNRKYELNENLDGTDVTEVNANYITGGRTERRKVWEQYRDHTLGYIHYRQTVMGEKHIGLADDEFVKNDNLPYTLYVREGRRLVGLKTVNERDCVRVPGFPRPPLRPDSIAVSDWTIDSHAVARDTEGYIFLGIADRYKVAAPVQAPYGAMVPVDVDGLLVPMAVSATHVGFQVLRLEPIRVALGQAAGTAAAICVKRRLQPRHVPIAELQETLLRERQALYFYKDVVPSTPYFDQIQRVGLRGIDPGDDTFKFRPSDSASYAEIARYLFKGLNLQVKMDYSDLWKVMPHRTPHFASPGHRQHCTPAHWATYYLLTLHNMGAFSEAALTQLDPNAPALRRDLIDWSKAAITGHSVDRSALAEQAAKADGPLTRAELADFIIKLTPNAGLGTR